VRAAVLVVAGVGEVMVMAGINEVMFVAGMDAVMVVVGMGGVMVVTGMQRSTPNHFSAHQICEPFHIHQLVLVYYMHNIWHYENVSEFKARVKPQCSVVHYQLSAYMAESSAYKLYHRKTVLTLSYGTLYQSHPYFGSEGNLYL